MKVGIVGAGMVGSAAGFAMALDDVVRDIVLVDQNDGLARAQAADISHAVPFAGSVEVTAGDYDALEGAGIVVISAGVNQKPGESRIDLLSRNAEVFRDVIGQALDAAPDAMLLIASNPVDIMTDISLRLSDLPAHRVIGSGTILDTARFRSLLGRHLGVSPQSVHAYVLGEHGDSEVLAWSSAQVGTVNIAEVAAQVGAPITDAVRQRIDDDVRGAAAQIIDGKGATNYGIGAGLARIVRAIATDEEAVLSVSCRTADVAGIEDVTLSLPRLIGAKGAMADLRPDLNDAEIDALRASARMLRDTAHQVTL